MEVTPREKIEESNKRRVAKWMAETRRCVNYAVAMDYINKLFSSNISADKERWNSLLEEYRKEDEEKRKAEAEAELELEKAEEQAQKERASYAAYLKFCREVVPPHFRDASVEKLDGVVKIVAQKILKGRSCYVTGDVGTGKTFLIWACAKEFMRYGEACTVIKADRMLSMIKGGFSEKEDCYQYAERVFGESIKHLFIDEISDVSMTDSDRKYLKFVIDYRYERDLQRCIFGNKRNDKTMAEQVGEAVFSRQAGDGAFAFEMPGRDRRRKEEE